MTIEKLQKVLQAAGIESRRNIRQAIHEERISINNQVITNPNFPVDISKDIIRMDEKKIKIKIDQKAYYILNKPMGVVTTLDDPQQRPTIKDFIKDIPIRVYPVGRLDYNSEGLILLTNDGDLTHFIISAKNQVPKVYMVKIKGTLTQEELKNIAAKGVFVERQRIKPLSVDFIKKTAQGNSWLRVSIIEGKKHVVRNLFKYIGHPVEKLKRIAVGTIQLKKLPIGQWRELSPGEIAFFKRKHDYSQVS